MAGVLGPGKPPTLSACPSTAAPRRTAPGPVAYQALVIMEPYWVQQSVNMPRPQFTAQRLGDYVSQCQAKGGAVTINLGMYQDGTVDPRAVDVLKEVRKRIGGPSSSTPGPARSAPGDVLTRQTQTDAPPATSFTLDPAKVNILMGLWRRAQPVHHGGQDRRQRFARQELLAPGRLVRAIRSCNWTCAPLRRRSTA